jgi:hypothetical protein
MYTSVQGYDLGMELRDRQSPRVTPAFQVFLRERSSTGRMLGWNCLISRPAQDVKKRILLSDLAQKKVIWEDKRAGCRGLEPGLKRTTGIQSEATICFFQTANLHTNTVVTGGGAYKQGFCWCNGG